jgi:hypothetical protein
MCHLCADYDDPRDEDRPDRAELDELAQDLERSWSQLPEPERKLINELVGSDPWAS